MSILNFFKKTPIYERYCIISNDANIFSDLKDLQSLEDSIELCISEEDGKAQFELLMYDEGLSDVVKKKTSPVLSKNLQWGNKKKPSNLIDEISRKTDIKYINLTIFSSKPSYPQKNFPNVYLDIFYDIQHTHKIHLAIKKELIQNHPYKTF